MTESDDRTPASWWIYRGIGPVVSPDGTKQAAPQAEIPGPPSWRRFHGEPPADLPEPDYSEGGVPSFDFVGLTSQMSFVRFKQGSTPGF